MITRQLQPGRRWRRRSRRSAQEAPDPRRALSSWVGHAFAAGVTQSCPHIPGPFLLARRETSDGALFPFWPRHVRVRDVHHAAVGALEASERRTRRVINPARAGVEAFTSPAEGVSRVNSPVSRISQAVAGLSLSCSPRLRPAVGNQLFSPLWLIEQLTVDVEAEAELYRRGGKCMRGDLRRQIAEGRIWKPCLKAGSKSLFFDASLTRTFSGQIKKGK